MDKFVSRKKRKLVQPEEKPDAGSAALVAEDTDTKVAILASLHPSLDQSILFETLIAFDGSIKAASASLEIYGDPVRAKRTPRSPQKGVGYQSSLSSYRTPGPTELSQNQRSLTTKGRTLHLYAPEDVAVHSPCSIIHNFLPADEAEKLLRELLEEAKNFERQSFKIFDNVVQSPHTACFYVESNEERRRQQTEYLYNGSNLTVGNSGATKWHQANAALGCP